MSAGDIGRLRARHGHRDGADLIKALRDEYGEKFAVISSFGIESAVLLDLVASVDKAIPVIFLDTNELFDETHAYVAKLTEWLGLTDLRHILPNQEELTEAEELWRSDTNRCCYLRKVLPLQRAAQGFSVLADGRKRFHGADRAKLSTFEEGALGIIKVSPLARWNEVEIQEHFRRRNLPEHPLAAQGFRSVGCWPCSRAARPGEGPRDGRWAGSSKAECGIHLPEEMMDAALMSSEL
ncbi:MAG TPA: phosphoadenylyl-sulfate reductase [Magnetospirillaceae bacterium]|nr:phosphoadenylyl-sulfate reductase [Magnetospirillaceae bacterium]